MRKKTILCSAIVVLGAAAIAGQALALTAGEVLDRMTAPERAAYTFGSMEMAAFTAHASGNAERGRCIVDWYSNKDGLNKILQAMAAFKDQEAQPIMFTLFKRACGE